MQTMDVIINLASVSHAAPGIPLVIGEVATSTLAIGIAVAAVVAGLVGFVIAKTIGKGAVAAEREEARRTLERAEQEARAEAERIGVPFLGEIPLDKEVRMRSDSGEPVVATQPDSLHAALYRDVARQVWAALEGGGLARPAPRICDASWRRGLR